MAFSAAENTRVGGVRKNASDAGVMPHLSAPCTVTLSAEISRYALSSEALMHVFIIDDSYNRGFAFVDGQFKNLMPALVEVTARNKVVAVRSIAALEKAIFNNQSQSVSDPDGSLFMFPRSLTL